jgi:RNA polymerase sigma-70 factor (ECF subfamily)
LPRPELTDEVVAAAATGDSNALGTVYAALAPSVLGYLRSRAVEDPEAVTNDVFVKLLPQIRNVRGGADGVRKLTFTIARARMVDQLRARGRVGPMSPYDTATDQRAVPSAEDEAHAAISLARVHAVLNVLPEDQREVLTLRVVADLSIEQVADVMGRSQGAIKQLQRRGMLALRAALDERRVTL